MMHAGSLIQTSRPCQVGTDYVPDAAKGVVMAKTDVLGTPIYIVRFNDTRLLPMREEEIQEATEP